MTSDTTKLLAVTRDTKLLALLQTFLLPPLFLLDTERDIVSAKHKINETHFDLILIDLTDVADNASCFTISDEESVVILLSDNASFDHIAQSAQNYGILTLQKSADAFSLYSMIQTALAVVQKVRIVLRKSTALKEKMDELKLVTKAKLHLMETQNLTEEAAHRLIEKRAMDNRTKRVAIAKEILSDLS